MQFGGTDGLGRVHHGSHPVLGHQPGQVRGGAERAPIDFGQAEGRILGGHDDVGIADQSDAPAEAEAVDGGDHRHLAVVDSCERGRAAAVDADEGLVPLCLDLFDVDAGTEPSPLGSQDHHPDVGILAGPGHGLGQGEPARHVQGVDRRVVDDHLCRTCHPLRRLDTHRRSPVCRPPLGGRARVI